ncbi:MAG TPA: ABC transporter permease subunit [Candidatus Dormibacteraeota bacterium]|jgi:ABC-type transport system involved in multi-copper enzyme maturation permease subunit
MLAAFTWESFKLFRRPAVWVCIGLLLALAVGLGYVAFYFFYTYAPNGPNSGLPRGVTPRDFKIALYPAAFVKYTLSTWDTLGGVFALILGVLSQGSEYGWGTIKTLYTQRPGRVAMLAGKLGALSLAVLVLVLTLFAIDALSSYLVAAVDGKSASLPATVDILKGVAAGWLIFEFWAVFGFFLATLFRQSALAIGLGLAYAIVIEGIIFRIAGAFGGDTVKRVLSWFPVANTGYLTESFGAAVPAALARTIAKPIADANHAVIVLLIYMAVFIAVAAVLVSRRDVAG